MADDMTKLRLAVQAHTDLEALRTLAQHLVTMWGNLHSAPGGNVGGYRVYSPYYEGFEWWEVARGTRDYCQGYLDGAQEQEPGLRMASGRYVCAPEQDAGLWLEGRIFPPVEDGL